MKKTTLSVSEQIIKQNRDFFHIYSHIASGLGLSESSFWIMYIISDSDNDYTQQKICNEWLFSKQTINSAIKCLEDRGYIYLVKARLPDVRKKYIKLTCMGEKFVKNHIVCIHQAEQNAIAKMTLQEQKNYLELSEKYILGLRKTVNP